MRVRGLKQDITEEDANAEGVAPRAGAWIETLLKDVVMFTGNVAPRAGAWIETQISGEVVTWVMVAPRAGAWIETNVE